MSFDRDFEDFFEDLNIFDPEFMKRFQTQLSDMLKRAKNGELKGDWETREINEPGVKGFIVQGWFGTDKALEPLEPLRPWKRPLTPEKPFGFQRKTEEEMREPLTDIFEEDNAFKVYAELPGEEKEDITFKIADGKLEVKARSFCKTVNMPSGNIIPDKATSEYKNGVLTVTVPKKLKLHEKDHKNTKAV
jgi:HSP20 family molecular chaperone IbpA